jgi:hypothetical protein
MDTGLFFYRLCEMLGIVMANQPMIFQVLNLASATKPLPTKFEFLDPHLLGMLPSSVIWPYHTHTRTQCMHTERTHGLALARVRPVLADSLGWPARPPST